MSAVQGFHLAAILLISIVLSVIYSTTQRRRASWYKVVLSGVFCCLFGIGMACLTGKDCYDVALLVNTGGFGRAYVIGLGISLSGIIIAIVCLVKKGN